MMLIRIASRIRQAQTHGCSFYRLKTAKLFQEGLEGL
jgi:hypothetical protein